MLQAVTAYKSWRFYQAKLPVQNNQCIPSDLERGFEEETPLRSRPSKRSSADLVDVRHVDMLILQEAENITHSR